jgi:L,D-peptidoglycan transpeptidase YkuD (ErfK/YbiS/YcfS/YnhG family)
LPGRYLAEKTRPAAAWERFDPAFDLEERQDKQVKPGEDGRFPHLIRGRLNAGALVLPCAFGRAGIRHAKREGDHTTPAGRFRLLRGYYRPDRIRRLAWALKISAMSPSDGWCDDPASACYNRPVRLPFREGYESMWRQDRLYDLVIVLDCNFCPRRKYRGSAIFLHCARPDFAPTEGCIALAFEDLRRLLPRLARNAVLIIR